MSKLAEVRFISLYCLYLSIYLYSWGFDTVRLARKPTADVWPMYSALAPLPPAWEVRRTFL